MGGGKSGVGQMERMKKMRGRAEIWGYGRQLRLPSNLMMLGVASCSLSFHTLTGDRNREHSRKELMKDEQRIRKRGVGLNGPLMSHTARKKERCVSNQECNSLLCVFCQFNQCL